MPIIVNTNVQSLVAQRNLTKATNGLSSATEKLSTGLKINSASDDPAGLFIGKGLESTLSGSEQCQTNIALGVNVLQIAEGDLATMQDNVLRIKDLATQAASGVYSTASRVAMTDEIKERLAEIDRISAASNFNGFKLLDGTNEELTNGLRIQVGAGSAADANSITVQGVFGTTTNSGSLNLRLQEVNDEGLYKQYKTTGGDGKSGTVILDGEGSESLKLQPYTEDDGTGKEVEKYATTQSGDDESPVSGTDCSDGITINLMTASAAAASIEYCEQAIQTLTKKRADIGVAQVRLNMAAEGLATTIENVSSAKSTIMDTDVAATTSDYTKQQILQQISTSILTSANQAPSVALSMIG